MDYSKILNELDQASLFDLYRLNVAIDQQLENPGRNKLVKKQLKIGQSVEHFNSDENRLVVAKVVKLKRTRTLVKNEHDGRYWDIPYYMINIDAVDTDIHTSSQQKLSKSNVKVGDKVCFKDREGNELFGEVVKLNPKTAAVMVGRVRWRVGYSLLIPVIDGELGGGGGQMNLLEGEVLARE